MKELLVLLTAASAALTGGYTVDSIIESDEIEIVRSEKDIDAYVYDTCMYIMSNDKYDFEDAGVRNVLNFYQEIAYTDELSVEEKAWLLDTMANEYMHECIEKDGHLCWYIDQNDSISINMMY